MKAIAINIFEFTTWYKFGYRYIPSELIIDLSDFESDGEVLLHKVGFFEEEYEVFFIEIPEININDEKNSFKLSLHDVLSIMPLTNKGGKILSSKIPDFKISEEISRNFIWENN